MTTSETPITTDPPTETVIAMLLGEHPVNAAALENAIVAAGLAPSSADVEAKDINNTLVALVVLRNDTAAWSAGST